uniref:Uncharacterized protein n=1 Tax=Panagrolaimus sp. ES5 TaxID=591445 RepID=A0AC34FZG1_9BILA
MATLPIGIKLISQLIHGFSSLFLVADRVVVTTRSIDDKQYIWESDSSSYSFAEDPRGNTLKRGSQITLYLKEEAYDFLEPDTLKKLVQKYSQFINFDIFLWQSKAKTEEKEDKAENVVKNIWYWQKIVKPKPHDKMENLLIEWDIVFKKWDVAFEKRDVDSNQPELDEEILLG